ncbi:hypothetical protein CSB45_07730 [candidate division KSB3 bacterium]|uniref:FAD:protein FMN transferase n=1 Tax=candidate division KSB3 bacterium TaxID=2044937 RepID=A0A2G6E5Q1_9BACT|nr:MAG: hypothetical protein CSB45_07730 [candidate division KSB3 bacterium]PIE29921.1 MAG: hypothetical protein CSA57_06430 [candidate division KSB3 bacterium]
MHNRFVRSRTKLSIACVFFIVGVLFAGMRWRRHLAPDVHTHRQTRLLLNTVVELIINSADEAQAQKAMEAAFAEIQRIEVLMSRDKEGSQIRLINQYAGQKAVQVSDEVKEVLERSLMYARQTDGLFDIRIGPLVELWGIGTEHEQIPLRGAIDSAIAHISTLQIAIRPNGEVFLDDPHGSLDIGGIAKGYSVDRAIEVLKQHGITRALLNAGGDIRCIGAKAEGSPWRIGVKHPRDEGILAVIELQDMAVATSGDYERFFLQENLRYHHLLDPRNGFPARGCRSVTIVASTTAQADAMATAVFIMGPQHGLEFIEAQGDIEGMIVDADGKIVSSSGFSFQPNAGQGQRASGFDQTPAAGK